MNRVMPLVFCTLTCALVCVPASADDPPSEEKELTPTERKELEAKAQELMAQGEKTFDAGKSPDAEKAFTAALGAYERLYPKQDHADLAWALHCLAMVLDDQGKKPAAELRFRTALAMFNRLYPKQDDRNLAICANAYGGFLMDQGKLADAEEHLRVAVAAFERVFPKQDHASLVGSRSDLAVVLELLGRYADAERLYRDVLAMKMRLDPKDTEDLSILYTRLALVCRTRGDVAEAEQYHRAALDLEKRVRKGDHDMVVQCTTNLAGCLFLQGKLTEAEALLLEALEMCRRLGKKDDRDVARCLNDLATVLKQRGDSRGAEKLFADSLDIWKRLYKGDHHFVAIGLINLGVMRSYLRDLEGAEKLLRDGLAMFGRLYKDEHPETAIALQNLALVLRVRGKAKEAEEVYRAALRLFRRAFKAPNPGHAWTLNEFGDLLRALGKDEEALSCFRESARMYRALCEDNALRAAEGDSLTLLASFPTVRDGYFSTARALKFEPRVAYAEIWGDKGTVTRVAERRAFAARSAADPKAAAILRDLRETRRRRAELILAPDVADPKARTRREELLTAGAKEILRLEKDLRPLLPSVHRLEALRSTTPADLQKELPADAAFVDLLAWRLREYDPKKPGIEGQKWTPRYLAFVVTRDRVEWVDLGPAEALETVVGQWREAITTPPFAVPADIPAKVRELAWEPIRKILPDGVKAVYVSADAALTRVPWGALPGDKPGTILLENVALASVPHGQFLLDMLRPAEKRPNPPTVVFAVGGIDFEDRPGGAAGQRPQTVPVDPKKALTWAELPGAKAEAEQVVRRAAGRKFETKLLTGSAASTDQILEQLASARVAHLATHGFFADKQFRSVLQIDPKLFETAQFGRERIGVGSLNPLVMSGLVFAGANRPETPGRGILTGESLIDRDLSGLELAVLSACETGLGDVAGGEGVYGLQRAFHVAGTRNVVASLWKVPDAATAALMGEFYRHLWDEKNPLPPIEALRQAQLAVYRADPKQFAEMARRGPGLGDTDFDKATKVIEKAPINKSGKNPPVVWAAWSLSGPGR